MNGNKRVSIEGWRDRLLLDFREVGVLLGVSVRNVYRLAARHELQQAKVGRRSAITVASLAAYYDRITTGGGAA